MTEKIDKEYATVCPGCGYVFDFRDVTDTRMVKARNESSPYLQLDRVEWRCPKCDQWWYQGEPASL